MNARGLALAGAACAMLLSGCVGSMASSGMGSAAMPPRPHASARVPAAVLPRRKPLLFVADLDSHVLVYSADVHASNPPLVAEITQGVTRSQSVWVDRKGTLYVVNLDDPPSIVEYNRGSLTPSKTIADGMHTPAFVAADGSGNVYVDDIGNDGVVVLAYAHGATSPTATIALPDQGRHAEGGALAFDRHGDLLVGTFAQRNHEAHVYRIPHRLTHAIDLGLQGLPGAAIATDRAGNLYVAGPDSNIEVYGPGSTTPSRSLAAPNVEFYGGITVGPDGTIFAPPYPGVDAAVATL